MSNKKLLRILTKLQTGEISIDKAVSQVNDTIYIEDDSLTLDTARYERLGFNEIVYGRSKSASQIEKIARVYLSKGINFICTGLDSDKLDYLQEKFPYFEFILEAGFMRHLPQKIKKIQGMVSIITAGTSDKKVAMECQETLTSLGIASNIYYDIGVAGVHRLFAKKEMIIQCDVIIVIAGMEGALPSVVGGIFSKPIIAVPTSVGYGTALEGFTALFSMLTSCANGISVVNIDNGFGAAMAAFRILYTFTKT